MPVTERTRSRLHWGGILLVAGLALWFSPRWAGRSDPANGTGEATEGADLAPVGRAITPAGTSDGERSPLRGAIRILAADTGEPLSSAVAAWTVAEGGKRMSSASAPSAPVPLPVDGEGKIDHERLPIDLAQTVVLLVSHPGFHSRSIVCTGGTRPIDWPAEIRLERAALFSARVVDSKGGPVIGAIVEHLVDDRIRGPLSARAEPARPWSETVTSGVDGLAALSSFPGQSRLQASFGDLRSAWWSGVSGDVVELRLLATFRARGRVVGTDGRLSEELRVRVLARESEEYEPLATCAVGSDGSWASETLPVLSVDSYAFLLEGKPFAQQRRDVRSPAPGSTVDVEFAPIAGVELQIRVRDSQGKNIQGAFVSVHWNESGAWQKLERLTDAAGIAVMTGCRPGSIWVRARANGRVPRLLPESEYYEAPATPIEVELDRAGRIEGICSDRDVPVTDFDVHFWQGLPTSKTTVHIAHSADGSFAIDEAPLGEVVVMAVTPDGLRTEGRRVLTQQGDVAHVVLETLPGERGSGRVAASSGEAIEGARVQVHATADLWKIGRCGSAAITDAQGRFDLAGLIQGRNAIEISAAGYASKKLELVRVEDRALEIGTVVLDAQRAVEVALTSDVDFDCTRVTAQLSGENFSGERRFRSDCELRYEALDPGQYELRIQHDDGSNAFVYFELTPDRDRRLDVPWSAHTLSVEIVPAPGTDLPPGSWLLASHRLATGEDVSEFYAVPSHRQLEIRKHEHAASIVLQLEDAGRAMLALDRFAVAPGTSEPLVLRVTGEAVVLRVTDREDQPISGAILSLFLSDDPSGWAITQRTDERGTCTLRGFVPDDLVVNVYHAPLGLLPSRRISVDRKQPNELVLDASLTLRAKVEERGLPLADVQVDASDGHGLVFGLGKRASDAAGHVDWKAVGTGEYRLRVQQPGLWPAESHVVLAEGSAPAVLEVRRRGDIEFHVQSNLGTDVQGALVDLQSIENHAWASEWLAQGAIEASSAALRTDGEGRVRLQGLPNGDFRYRVTAASGAIAEAVVSVPPASIKKLAVTLP
jgi:hypothetical protein